MPDAVREGSVVLFADTWEPVRLEAVDLAPADGYRAPWWEECEGCSGSGVAHAGERLAGPCGACWGLGAVLFAFTTNPRCVAAVHVPMAVAVALAPELVARKAASS